LAALLYLWADGAAAAAVCQRWRLSNRQTQRTAWLVEHHAALRQARAMRWSQLQPLLVAEGIEDLIALEEADSQAASTDTSHVTWCRSLVAQPREQLDPPPLITGDDLLRHGVPPGPEYRALLERVRDAQLDNEIRSPTEALERVDRLRGKMKGTA
jgi:poly(A) polymerase